MHGILFLLMARLTKLRLYRNTVDSCKREAKRQSTYGSFIRPPSHDHGWRSTASLLLLSFCWRNGCKRSISRETPVGKSTNMKVLHGVGPEIPTYIFGKDDSASKIFCATFQISTSEI